MHQKIYQKIVSLVRKSLPVIIIIFFSFLLILPQIASKGVIVGSDFLFHYNRFYETATQLKTGNFSYFISLYGFYSSGRIVNALYGPYFAYLQGFLVLISKNWFTYQLVSRFFLSFLAGMSMYALLNRVVKKRSIKLSIALLYMTTFSIQYWTFRQGFSSWGAAIMPWCLIPAIDFVKDKTISVWRLAISVALMTQIHMLSAFFLICLYVPFYLYGFIKSDEKKVVLFKGIVAVLLCLLLSSNIWAAVLEVGSHNNLVEPFVNSKLYIMTVNQKSIQWLITPFPLLLILLYCLYFTFRHWRHYDKTLRVVMGAFFLFLVLSSSIFPWYTVNQLQIGLVNLIQFPFRFFIPATILLLLAFAMILERYFAGKWARQLIFLLLITNIVSLSHVTYLQIERIHDYYTAYPVKNQKHQFSWGSAKEIRQAFYANNKHDLLDLISKSTPDYLPSDKTNKENKYTLYEEFVLAHTDEFHKSQSKGQLTLTWTADTANKVIIPIAKYDATELVLNGKKLDKEDYALSAIGTPTVQEQAGENTLIVTYRAAGWFYPILLINLATWLSSLTYVSYQYYVRYQF